MEAKIRLYSVREGKLGRNEYANNNGEENNLIIYIEYNNSIYFICL